MEKEFVDLWEEHREDVRKEFLEIIESGKLGSYEEKYFDIFKLVARKCFGNYYYNEEEVSCFQEMDYEGVEIYVFKYRFHIYYTGCWFGSCSGCDTLMSIIYEYEITKDKETALKDLMSLALSLIQNIHRINTRDLQ